MKGRLLKAGIETYAPATPAETGAYLKQDIERYRTFQGELEVNTSIAVCKKDRLAIDAALRKVVRHSGQYGTSHPRHENRECAKRRNRLPQEPETCRLSPYNCLNSRRG